MLWEWIQWCIVQAIMMWLPNAEMKLMSMSLIATNPRSVRIQIEEFKVHTHIFLTPFVFWLSSVMSVFLVCVIISQNIGLYIARDDWHRSIVWNSLWAFILAISIYVVTLVWAGFPNCYLWDLLLLLFALFNIQVHQCIRSAVPSHVYCFMLHMIYKTVWHSYHQAHLNGCYLGKTGLDGNQCRFFCRLDALPVTSQTASDLRSPQYNMSFIWHPYGMWHVGVPGADVQVAVGHAQFESVHCWTEADVTSGHCVRCHWECRRA